MSKEYLPPKLKLHHTTAMQGCFLIKNMTRLCQNLLSDEGEVDVALLVEMDDQGVRVAKSRISAEVRLQCQRCMDAFSCQISSEFALGIVTNEREAAALPKKYDPVWVTDNMLLVQDMVEDELIIQLPIVAMHDPIDCKIHMPFVIQTDEVRTVKKDNPFKVIEGLNQSKSQ